MNTSLGVFDETMAAERAALENGSGYGGGSGTTIQDGVADAGPGISSYGQTQGLQYPGQGGEASTTGTQDGTQPGASGTDSASDGPSDQRILVAGTDGGTTGGGRSVVGGGGGDDRAHANRVPDDIPTDGSDDDIVARQLREAAMNEPDAELREKLWQEYRDYRKASGR